jgi:hypothetical protein
MMPKYNRFARGTPTFKCDICQRLTRNAGQPTDSTICFECWELAGWDNSVNDGAPLEEAAAARDELLDKAVKLGGNEARMIAEFTYLFPGGVR